MEIIIGIPPSLRSDIITSWLGAGFFCEFLEDPFGNLIGFYGPLLVILRVFPTKKQILDQAPTSSFPEGISDNLIDPRLGRSTVQINYSLGATWNELISSWGVISQFAPQQGGFRLQNVKAH